MRFELRAQRAAGFTVEADITVQPGEIVALVGPNGAGKTTALLALAGLVDQSSNSGFEGVRVGVVFQDGLLFPHMTVRENVEFGALRDVDEVMDEFGISTLADQRPGSLSGGEQQRVAIARTMATAPELLLLDEPMSALDVSAKAEMRRYLSALFTELGCAVLLVAHDPLDALGLADRVYVMEDGRIVQSGTPSELRSRPETDYVADLAGVNLLSGESSGNEVHIGNHVIRVVALPRDGSVLVQIHPNAISIHLDRPIGSARNVWKSTVAAVEVKGPVARISFDEPIPITAEITSEAVDQLSISVGSDVYLAVKATEIDVRPE